MIARQAMRLQANTSTKMAVAVTTPLAIPVALIAGLGWVGIAALAKLTQ